MRKGIASIRNLAHFVFATAMLFAISMFAAPISACGLTIIHKPIESKTDILTIELLQLSIANVRTDVCYQAEQHVVTDTRKTANVLSGRLSLKWGSLSKEQMDMLKVVPIPIFKGLLGHRVLVIRKGEQLRFDNVSTLQDLQKFIAGSGKTWGDTAIFRNSGIEVVTSPRGRQLWGMLEKHRFDYLALGIYEPWEHIDAHYPQLDVENRLLIVYPMALVFYVHPENSQLYNLIKTGMDAAIKDGSYDKKLIASRNFQIIKQRANINQRHIIRLPNPDFPSVLNAQSHKYWLDPQFFSENN
ncbi:hypothetical protein [Agaribacter marinus]|uniref:Solute-binding protein family 3/N-terminal domain-containing protein n=1 Tax=Agaribacter marinus TaxID=1431249 RepID=A0AA37WJT3_9ALTE|nr:hypothetical protein [Agaribacter marinus]GLR70205.1 hypothetical protein GCM10007852_11130 [Agaribacter marinus]